MADATITKLNDAVRQLAHSLTGAAVDYNPLLDLIGDARFVLRGLQSEENTEPSGVKTFAGR